MAQRSKRNPMNFFKRILPVALVGFCTALAFAQDYPSRPIKFVVPSAVGGGSDILARIIGQKLSEKWGQAVVIENRTGAGGNIGTGYVATSTPDGYTWLLGFVGTHAVNPSLYKNLTWNPIKDFTPVALLATIPYVLVINKDLPATNLAEFLALAKQKPGELNYGSGGSGTLNHLFGPMLEMATGVKFRHVPYRGVGPALTDLMGGQIQFIVGTAPSVLGLIDAGKVRPIAVTSAKRLELLKDVPTLAESGFASFVETPWFGVLAPAGTPAAVVEKINGEVNRLFLQKDVSEQFAKLGMVPSPTTTVKFAQIIQSDIAKWAIVVKESGATVD